MLTAIRHFEEDPSWKEYLAAVAERHPGQLNVALCRPLLLPPLRRAAPWLVGTAGALLLLWLAAPEMLTAWSERLDVTLADPWGPPDG